MAVAFVLAPHSQYHSGIMSNESLKPISPTMYYIGTVLGIVVEIIYCIVLFMLRHVEKNMDML